jgi:ABC-type iron transport system FetAB ATPase subunit
MPTFDKVLAVKRILASSLPNIKFDDKNIKEMIARFGKYSHALSKLIDSSGGEWNREDLTEEVVTKASEEITAIIDEMTEAQYKLFVEKSVKQIKLNDFYR